MKKFTKAEKSWIFYDWANSVYATIIMAAIFPIYFSNMAAAVGRGGDVLWGYATSVATLFVAVAAPFLGAIADFKGMKKKLFSIFLLVGLAFTLLMALTDNLQLMLLGYAVSYVGFAGANLFYDSFLTDVSSSEKMDSVSGYGYALGYIGGSTIAFLISIALVMFGHLIGIDSILAVKLSVVLTVVWWGVFSIPMLRNVQQVHSVPRPEGNVFASLFQSMKGTVRDILSDKRIRIFMIAYFFYIDGLGTVIHMATSYGSTLGLSGDMMIIALLVTQLVAVPFSILFGKFSSKIGTIKMLLLGISVYICVCLVGFFMGFTLEPHQFAYETAYQETMAPLENTLSADAFSSLERGTHQILSSHNRIDRFPSVMEKVLAEYPTEVEALSQADVALSAFLAQSPLAAPYDYALRRSTLLFWILAVLVGTSQGGLQALSRSYFGRMIPKEKSNNYFGFFDIFGKFASVMGPALYALFAQLTGRSSIGILSLILLFVVSWLILFFNRHHFSG